MLWITAIVLGNEWKFRKVQTLNTRRHPISCTVGALFHCSIMLRKATCITVHCWNLYKPNSRKQLHQAMKILHTCPLAKLGYRVAPQSGSTQEVAGSIQRPQRICKNFPHTSSGRSVTCWITCYVKKTFDSVIALWFCRHFIVLCNWRWLHLHSFVTPVPW